MKRAFKLDTFTALLALHFVAFFVSIPMLFLKHEPAIYVLYASILLLLLAVIVGAIEAVMDSVRVSKDIGELVYDWTVRIFALIGFAVTATWLEKTAGESWWLIVMAIVLLLAVWATCREYFRGNP